VVIVEIIVVVGLYTYILLRVPALRLSGGIVAFALLGGLFYYLFASDPQTQAALLRVETTEITVSDLDLEIGVRTSNLSGRVVNGSALYEVTGIVLDVKLFDCPDDTAPLTECFTIGEDDSEARVSVPPGQLRDFNATLLFTDLPEITGEFRWTHELIGVRALGE